MIFYYFQAIKDGDEQLLKNWLSSSVNIIVDDRAVPCEGEGGALIRSKGMRALHYAAFHCKLKIVPLLLDAGAGKCLVFIVSLMDYGRYV